LLAIAGLVGLTVASLVGLAIASLVGLTVASLLGLTVASLVVRWLMWGVNWCRGIATNLSPEIFSPGDVEPVLAEAADVVSQVNLLGILGHNRADDVLKFFVQLIKMRSVLLFSLGSLARDLILNSLDGLGTLTDETSKFGIVLTLDIIDFLTVKARERAKFLGVSLLDANKTMLVRGFDIANNSVHVVNVLCGCIGWLGWCWSRLVHGRVDMTMDRLVVVSTMIVVDDFIMVDVLVEEVILLMNEVVISISSV